MKTTLNAEELRNLNACKSGYNKFLQAHGEQTVTLSQAIESNRWDDIWWFISSAYHQFSNQQKENLDLLGCDWAESCLKNFESEYPEDERPKQAIEAKRKFLEGEITRKELSAAESAAWSAAESAAWSAAWSAAESAARSAAESAAESAAWSAAWSAAESAAWSAAESAEESAAESAEESAMEKQLKELFLKWESEDVK